MTEKLVTFVNRLNNPKILTITVIVIMGGILIIAAFFFMNDSQVSRSAVEDKARNLMSTLLGQAKPG